MSDSFKDRLNTFRAADESDATFARRIGVAPATMCYWQAGREPAYETLINVAGRLGTTALWLFHGEGPRGRVEYRAWLREKEETREKS